MDILFNYLEKKYLETKYEPLKLEFRKTGDQLIIKNSFYYFRLNKLNDRYILSRFWKRGFLFFIFKKQNTEMNNIYEDITEFAVKKNIIIEELFYHNSAAN